MPTFLDWWALLPWGVIPWGLLPWGLVAAACALDRLLGDPRRCPHPVEVMGWAISVLRGWAEAWAGDRPRPLQLAGVAITAIVVGASGLAGWTLERLAFQWPPLGLPLLVAGLASALAGRSLEQAVQGVLAKLGAPELGAAGAGEEGPGEVALEAARERLSWIVGRDVTQLDHEDILRAAAETASENAVDGLFAPLFWMLVGAGLWSLQGEAAAAFWPGPLSLAWGFKAASTLDSMLGYRRGRLRWLGTAGARLDDLLTWLPCRLTALTLPLVAGWGVGRHQGGKPMQGPWRQFQRALREGAPDPSPNAGVSQAAYALAAGVRMGGVNRYGGELRSKPVLAASAPKPDRSGVERILKLSLTLEITWLLASLPLLLVLGAQ